MWSNEASSGQLVDKIGGVAIATPRYPEITPMITSI